MADDIDWRAHYQDALDAWNAEIELRKKAERERNLVIMAAIGTGWGDRLYVSIGARRMSNIPTQAEAIAQVKRYAGINNDET
jgi:hypothetical protein